MALRMRAGEIVCQRDSSRQKVLFLGDSEYESANETTAVAAGLLPS